MFKNLALYRFTEPFTLTSVELETKLKDLHFRPCGSHDGFSIGWTPPVGKEELIHACNGFMMLCLKREEKVIPASVVNEMLQEKITVIEESEARKLTRKERTAVKDELIFELLPRAFTHSKKTHAYIDPKGGWIIIDAASATKADDLLSHLRKCLGSLAVTPINTKDKPVITMTRWLVNIASVPTDLMVNYDCELRALEDSISIVRCKNHDLNLPEITNHLDTGKQVTKLAVTWQDRMAFIIDENLMIKRLKFLDLVQDQIMDIEAETEVERFDADFSIMSLEIANFLPRLIEVFGGEQ